MAPRPVFLALLAGAACCLAAAAPLPEEAAVPEEALAEGDECASTREPGHEGAQCALSALQHRRLQVTSASSANISANSSIDAASGTWELQIGDWRTSGTCANIITVESCKGLAAQLGAPFSRTHCDGITCAPRGCYQYRTPGQPNNLHVYWNSDKAGMCSLSRQCICEHLGYPAASGYAPMASVPYGSVPLTQAPFAPSGGAQASDLGAAAGVAAVPTPSADSKAPPRAPLENSTAPLVVGAAAQHGQIVTVYHQTSYAAGYSILRSQFRPGTHGICGGGIYFATSAKLTDIKIVGGAGFMIEAQVDLGRVKWMPKRCDPSMTGEKLRHMGYDSIRLDRSGWHECEHISPCGEVVIYDPHRVISMKGYPWWWTNAAGLRS